MRSADLRKSSVLAVLILLASHAFLLAAGEAEFEAGVALAKKKDYTGAYKLWGKAAAEGHARAMSAVPRPSRARLSE